MEFQKSYYIIEHISKLEIVSHEKLLSLDKNSYQLIQNFSNHDEAVAEMLRLLSDEQFVLKDKLANSK
jgi:hypothetical protein